MAKLTLSLLLVFSLIHYMFGMAEPAGSAVATNFIKTSCRATRYPALCIQCLSSYANTIQQSEQQLTQAALSVSLAKARSAAMFVSSMAKASGIKPIEYQAVKDCTVNMVDTVNQLSRSIQELGNMGGPVGGQDFVWHMNNVETWVSAALTDENICTDGFAGPVMDGNVKIAINNRVINVAQITSNALALVNRFAAKQRAAPTNSMP